MTAMATSLSFIIASSSITSVQFSSGGVCLARSDIPGNDSTPVEKGVFI